MFTKKIFIILILLGLSSNLSAQAPEDERMIMQYQIQISTQTADQIQKIFNDYNESFLDYESALKKLNILINEYNKAMQYMSLSIPPEGKKLDRLVRQLLSRVEKFFVYSKKTGRENPYINAQIYESLIRVAQETERLSYL